MTQAATQHEQQTHEPTGTVEEVTNLPSLPMQHDDTQMVVNSDASLMMNPQVFEHMQRVCKVYANSNVVPQQFQGNLANCMIAYELAYRMQVNVFMLMQSMYVVSGKPGLEAKLAIALVNTRGPFRGTIQFQVERDQKGFPVACTAYAVLKSTGDRCETRVTWDVVEREGWNKKSGSKWQTMPEQMFKYRSAAWLARTYCPEVLMGMHTVDELEDTYNNTRYIQSTARQTFDPSASKSSALADRLAGGSETAEPVDAEPSPQAEPEQATEPAPQAADEPDVEPVGEGDDAAADAPEPDNPHLSDDLVKQLANKCGCTLEESLDAVEGYCTKKLNGKSLPDLTAKQRKGVAASIDSGILKV